MIASNIHQFDTCEDRYTTALSILEKYGDAESVEDIDYFGNLYTDKTISKENFKEQIERFVTDRNEDFMRYMHDKATISRTLRLVLTYPDAAKEYADSLPKATVDEIGSQGTQGPQGSRGTQGAQGGSLDKMEKKLNEQAELITGSFSYRNGYQGAKEAYMAGAEWASARISDFLAEHKGEMITDELTEGELLDLALKVANKIENFHNTICGYDKQRQSKADLQVDSCGC